MAEGIKIDPAIERWAHVRENTHLYFKFNQRNTRKSLIWGVAVPIALTILAYKTDRKWDFAAAQTKEDLTPSKN
ncbi:hypothetical protein G6F70_002447 [Rhizopus microsporus]|uniref:NADH-ubiquinone oxidoreductase B15 subunit n=1 Tax=Rhizopus microsporus TaxID=58291 RepID=A0A0A1NFE8_RHIZD|nr:hypothetical protein G6F71_001141 [Rhizopus microsporus]KAG1202245.1 hypothetical protein G6F70_002447 [Rhizopus microsporus]KAG1213968.1 hypothetical protein G6F69_002363 [Rhizopus microsporus]KAG1236239.1 hypothetical protein G6F67_002156 [Rhizopus microsporus]KAG1268198.1 hypothetical protein G6F68_001322 [Rhizopus microsporus]